MILFIEKLLFSVPIPSETYVLTFHATGCPNPDPRTNYWKTISDGAVFQDMMAYCVLTRDGKADSRQINQCCGSTTCVPTSCNMMTNWREGWENFMLLI